jgi:hypothetical protein
MKALVKVLVVIVALSLPTAALAIGISFNVTSGGTLYDSVLFASKTSGAYYSVALHDLDLSTVTGTFVDVAVGDGSYTHWWLIGHQGDDVVYSSTLDLTDVDVTVYEPFTSGITLTPAMAINLIDNYNNGDPYSLEQWVYLGTNHASHIAADGEAADLWRFSEGQYLGQVAVSINNNIPPELGPPIPIPTTILLLGSGLIGLAGLRRKF